MGTVNVTLGDGKKLNLVLGQQLENAVTAVVFDFSAWQTELGSGTLGLSVQRHGDTQPYAVVPIVSGTNATWNISELDTAYKGVGEVQVTYTVGSVVKKSTVYKFTVYRSLGENGEYPSPGQSWQEEIEAELSDVKQDLAELKNDAGVTADLKSALLQLASKVAYIDDNGQNYYDDLYNALYPNAQSITCVYTQSSTVYSTDTLDSLKDDLVVTAHYSDSTTEVLKSSDYTLSGTLTAETSTVIVTYGNLSTSFTVTVTASYPITNTLAHVINSNVATSIGQGASYSATLTADTYYDISTVSVTMGGVDVTNTVYSDGEITIASVTGDIVITATAYIYKYDSSEGILGIYSGATSITSVSGYAGRIINDVSANATTRRSLYTSIVDGLDVLKKKTSSAFEETDYYIFRIPPDATSIKVTLTTTDESPYIGTTQNTLSGNVYTQLLNDGWMLGPSYTWNTVEGAVWFTAACKRNTSGAAYSGSEISRAIVEFIR